VIIKTISRKSNVDQLIRYVLTDEKLAPIKEPAKRPLYIPGVKLTKEDMKHLESEKIDAKLLAEFKAFKGSMKEFIEYCMPKNSTPKTQNKIEPIVIKNNIRARSVNGYIREFGENEKFRQNLRKDSVLAFHTILSFSQLDSKHLNEKVLKDIAQKYISLRAEQSLVVGAVHRDKDHTHIHLIQSGVQFCTGVSNRISRQQFQELKVAMQEYQIQKYPQLVHSVPEHGKSKNGKTKESGSEKNIKSERSLDKNILHVLLETTYGKSTSKEHFLAQLQEQGHVPYFRNGRFQGIKFEGVRKFRINRFGYDEKKLLELDVKKEKEEKSLQEIRQIRNIQVKELDELKRIDEGTPLGMDETKQRDRLQELVNQNRTFEAKNGITGENSPLDRDIAQLQQLRDIRESRGKELDRTDGLVQNGWDETEDRNSDDDRNDKEDRDSKPDDDTEDEDTTGSNADTKNDDDDADVR